MQNHCEREEMTIRDRQLLEKLIKREELTEYEKKLVREASDKITKLRDKERELSDKARKTNNKEESIYLSSQSSMMHNKALRGKYSILSLLHKYREEYESNPKEFDWDGLYKQHIESTKEYDEKNKYTELFED